MNIVKQVTSQIASSTSKGQQLVSKAYDLGACSRVKVISKNIPNFRSGTVSTVINTSSTSTKNIQELLLNEK